MRAKAPSFDELFSLIKSKPLMSRYFDVLGIRTATDMMNRFARKD